MKRSITTMTLAMLLVAAARVNAQDRGTPSLHHPGVDQKSTSGDGAVGLVGDLDFDSEITPAAAIDDDFVGDMSFVGDIASEPSSLQAPQPMPVSEIADAAAHDTSYTEAYPVFASGTTSSYRPARVKAPSRNWFRAETLLWFAGERDSPPLLTTGPNFDNQFGDPIDSGFAPGFRLDYGHYFGDGTFGIGARFWGLFGDEEEFTASSSDPANFIGRPFFNTTALGGPEFQQLLVSGQPGNVTGDFRAVSELDLIATEVYGRLNFDTGSNYSIDLIGGFSSFAIDDKLTLESRSNSNNFQVRSFRDTYDAENRFYGGQLGIETMFNRGKWSLTTLSKVHLGNMNQRVRIAGASRSAAFPDPPGPGNNFANGFYVQGQQGLHEQDEFSFAPELGIQLGYSPRKQINFTIGYSFIYWNNVALAGNQINPVLDGTRVLSDLAGSQSIGYTIEDDGFWLQGIDLGMTFTY